MFKMLWRKKFIIITLAVLLAFLPMAMTKEATVLGKTVITAIGLDKQNDEYIVWTESLIFNFDPFGVPERQITTAAASTIDEAFEEISLNMGRKLSFSHCSIILLGSGLEDVNLRELLWPFLLKPQLNNRAVLMWTDDDVGDVLQVSVDTGDVRSAKLQQIAAFNTKDRRRVATTLEELARSETVHLNVIAIENDGLVNSELVIAVGGDGGNKPV